MSDPASDEADRRAAENGLLAGRSIVDGRLVFPMPQGEEAAAYMPVILARRGRLWSWSFQRLRPKGANQEVAPAQTIAVGYVELAGELMVEGRLLIDDVATLSRGMELELTLQQEGDGRANSVFTYAFRPVPAEVR